MPIDDKVSADRYSFVFMKKKNINIIPFAQILKRNSFECQKINSNRSDEIFPSTWKRQTKREKWSDGVIPVFFLLFFNIPHSLKYIITACRCSLRIHSRAKRYRFFGNFHSERELKNRILSFSHFPAISFVSNSPPNYSRSLSICERGKHYTLALWLSHNVVRVSHICWISILAVWWNFPSANFYRTVEEFFVLLTPTENSSLEQLNVTFRK